MGKTIDRKIYFYRVDAGKTDGGAPISFDAAKCRRALQKLTFSGAGRTGYMSIDSEKDIIAWSSKAKNLPTSIHLAAVRRDGLPAVERDGRLTPLTIADDSGLAETAHAVFFDDNIVGWEFNFYGPRIGRLRDYLMAKVPGCQPHEYELLVNANVAAQVDDLVDVRLFDIQLTPSWASQLKAASAGFGNAVTELAKIGQAANVEIVLRAERGGTLSQKFKSAIRQIVCMDEFREQTNRAKVRGKRTTTGRVETIDLLNDAFVHHVTLPRSSTRTRGVETVAAVAAIVDAYETRKDDLKHAIGAR